MSETTQPLILASKSAARRAMLENAGVSFAVRVAGVDEDAIKAASGDLDPAALAVRLAEAKALAVSRDDEDAWVLGRIRPWPSTAAWCPRPGRWTRRAFA